MDSRTTVSHAMLLSHLIPDYFQDKCLFSKTVSGNYLQFQYSDPSYFLDPSRPMNFDPTSNRDTVTKGASAYKDIFS